MHAYGDALIQDVRFALRTYSKSPGFTFAALLALALGIGATSAVFSVTDRILFRPLPYRAGEQLVSFGMLARVVDDGEFLFAADYKNLFDADTPFQSITSWSGVEDCDITDQNPVRQRCAEVDWNFLSVLGVAPVLGQSFMQGDVQPGAPRKIILSYGVWQSRFARDRHIIGKTLVLDGAPARIAGVLPLSFELPTLQHADLLTPQVILPAGWQPGSTRVLRVVGRLKNAVSLKVARSELAEFFNNILSNVPAPFRKEVQFRVRSMRDRQMEGATLAAQTLLGSVLLVMLIACANVANLLLARAASRQTELAIRAAVGVSRARLLAQMLTESVLLALSGGIIGIALGAVFLHIAIAADPNGIPQLANASLDSRVLAISVVLSLLAGLVFGVAPALKRPRTEALGSWRSAAPRSSGTFKNVLMLAQIAVSTVLVTAAALLVRSLWNLETQPLGMQTEHVLTAHVILPSSRYRKPQERFAFFNQVEQQIGTIPGVRALGLSDSLPPGGWERSRPFSAIEVVGHALHRTGTGGLVDWRYVSPGYFEALRIPLLEGRGFREKDRSSAANLCILSVPLARRLFPAQSAVGQHVRIGEGAPFEIVGVVPAVKNTGLAAPDNPEYYILRGHSPDDTYLNSTGPVAQRTLSLVLRSAVPDATLASLVRERIAALDSTLPVNIETMPSRLRELAAGPRFDALLLVTFAGIGLFLAAVGLYATVSYLVTQRTQEIGIRMALGATPGGVAGLILTESARWTAAGVAVGVLGSLAAARLLSRLLFRVSERDPLTLVLAALCLFGIALLAAATPACKAASVDPMTALRNDN
jgi:predicted permease